MKTIVVENREIKQLTFEEWKAEYPDFVSEIVNDVKECPECGGDGLVECYHCGKEMDCEECDGTGKVGPDLEGIYRQQYKTDIYRLTRWLTENKKPNP